MQVSVIIKALNEERSIGRAIESSLNAIEECDSGEVILADSLSTDGTVRIAESYPIRIAQLRNPEDRCCGVGAQLGLEIAGGEFLYILDGDMELLRGFLPAAIALLRSDSKLAGVAGLVQEVNVSNIEFANRASRAERPGSVDRLNMGGLYRREALQSVGYFTNANLHAFEEFELGARLHSAGWRLYRMDVPAVRHYGHTDESYQLMLKRWRSGYLLASGEVVRSALGTKHLHFVLARMRILRFVAGVLGWWACLGLLLLYRAPAPIWALFVGATCAVLALLVLRKRSGNAAAYSILAWHFHAAGFIRGFIRPMRKDPRGRINFAVIK
jgi:glycosyltransferase involved in cell wall biosynthesis